MTSFQWWIVAKKRTTRISRISFHILLPSRRSETIAKEIWRLSSRRPWRDTLQETKKRVRFLLFATLWRLLISNSSTSPPFFQLGHFCPGARHERGRAEDNGRVASSLTLESIWLAWPVCHSEWERNVGTYGGSTDFEWKIGWQGGERGNRTEWNGKLTEAPISRLSFGDVRNVRKVWMRHDFWLFPPRLFGKKVKVGFGRAKGKFHH